MIAYMFTRYFVLTNYVTMYLMVIILKCVVNMFSFFF